MIIRDDKKNKEEIKNWLYLCYTRDQKIKTSKSKSIRNASSKRIEYLWQIVAKRVDDDKWTLVRINNENHNHNDDGKSTHTNVRRYFMISELREDIRGQFAAGAQPKAILTYVQNKAGADNNNPKISSKNIHNALQRQRARELGNRTPIQALNVEIQSNPDQWWSRVQLCLRRVLPDRV